MLKPGNGANKFSVAKAGGIKRMVRRLNLDKADETVKEFIKNLNVDEDQYVFEFGGKPVGALVSLDILNWWKEREESFSVYDEIWESNKNVSAREVRKDVTEAVKAIRSKKQ